MKSRWNSLVAGGCNVIGLMLLALSATAGGSAVRAAGDSPAPESIAIERLAKMVSGLEHRVAAFEASVAAFANTITATRIAARELCVADESGARTCITKAQLDALLSGARQTAQVAQTTPAQTTQPPEPETPASGQGACPDRCVAPAAPSTGMPLEMPPAIKETAATEAASAAAVARETMPPEEAAVPPAPPPVSDPPRAAESKAPVPAGTLIPTPRSEPAEAVIATTTRPELKEEAPAQADPATSGSAAPEPNAVPAQAPPDSERQQ